MQPAGPPHAAGLTGATGASSAADTARAEADLAAADAWQAVALLWVDPAGLGGVALHGAAGPVRDGWLALLQALAPAGAPVRRLPAQATEDRLLGGLDLVATLAAGRPVLLPGVLAQADGGLVIAAMAERLPAATAAHLGAALDRGELRLEREGLARTLRSRIGVVALDESQGDDPPLWPALADRLGLWIDLLALPLASVVQADAQMAHDVAQARSRVAEVEVPEPIVQALCAAAWALGAESMRAAWFAVRCARASAAWRGADQADEEDARLAVRLVLAPRATRVPQAADEEAAPADPPPTEPPEPPPDPEQNAAEAPPPPDPATTQPLEDRLVDASAAVLPPALLAALALSIKADRRTRPRDGGRAGALTGSATRGRPVGSRKGRPRPGVRLHLVDTLRAAAPWQPLRRQPGLTGDPLSSAVRLRVSPEDFHIRRLQQRRTTTTVFAIDASGSSALHRLAEAKGAVEGLLAECYVRRDEVAVIAFRGRSAELLLPPTRSLVRVRRALSGLPGGGGTPLAAGLEAAAALAARVRRSGSTPVTVLLTDGRANVGLDGQGGRARAQADALVSARRLAVQGGSVLVIDTSVRPEPAAAELARAAGARYLPLPLADAATLSRAVLHARPRD